MITAIPSDTWLPVGLLKAVNRSAYRMTVGNESDFFDLMINYDKKGNASIQVLDSINTSGAEFTFALGRECEDEFGGKYAYLYVKRVGTTQAGVDFTVSNLSIPREGDVFGHGLFTKGGDGILESKLEPMTTVTVK